MFIIHLHIARFRNPYALQACYNNTPVCSLHQDFLFSQVLLLFLHPLLYLSSPTSCILIKPLHLLLSLLWMQYARSSAFNIPNILSFIYSKLEYPVPKSSIASKKPLLTKSSSTLLTAIFESI